MNNCRRVTFILGGLLVLCAGCMDPGYFLHITRGELRSLSRSRPIDQVLQDESLPPEQACKLALVPQMRDYARDCIGLNVGSSYTHYEDIAGAPVAYSISAAYRDRLEPYEWSYPIIGKYDGKGYFDRKLAEDEMKRLRAKGLDAMIGEVSGFSTMGVLSDPVRSSNLKSDEIDLTILIFHELTHNTVFKHSDTQFNESIATFVGRTAALQFLGATFGMDSPPARAAARRVADLAVIDSYVCDLVDQIEALYREPISSEEKISRREAVFAGHRKRYSETYAPRLSDPQRYKYVTNIATNNATVLSAYHYYSRLDVYSQVHARLGGDLRATIALLKEASRQRDSQAFLRTWLLQHHEAPMRQASIKRTIER